MPSILSFSNLFGPPADEFWDHGALTCPLAEWYRKTREGKDARTTGGDGDSTKPHSSIGPISSTELAGVVAESQRARFLELLTADVASTLAIATAERSARLNGLGAALERTITATEKAFEEGAKRNAKPTADESKVHEQNLATRQRQYTQARETLQKWVEERKSRCLSLSVDTAAKDLINCALVLFHALRKNIGLATGPTGTGWQELGFHSAAEVVMLLAREMADFEGSAM